MSRAGIPGDHQNAEEKREMLAELKAFFTKYESEDYVPEIYSKTSFFTSGDRIDLFMELIDHLDVLGIS